MNLPATRDEVLTKLRQLPYQITELTPGQAFLALDSIIRYAFTYRELFGLLTCESLALTKKNWETFKADGHTGQWDYDFYKYAADRTGGFDRTTIDNMIRVGNTWLIGELPETVPETVPLYTKEGEPTEELVVPDPYTLNYSKLLVATGAANDGRLQDPKVLGQLFNPEVSVHRLSATIQGKAIEVTTINEDRMYLTLEGPMLLGSKGGETKIIAAINEDDIDHPIVEEAVQYIVAACKVTII